MNIIAIIPARGGSKGVPKKNIRNLAGKPLIYYTIKSANESKFINKVIVSSDDEEILDKSKEYGSTIIKRPKSISDDYSPTIDTILHVLEELKKDDEHYKDNAKINKKDEVDIVVLLQATSPFRTSEDIDEAIEKFLSKQDEFNSLISVSKFEEPPYWALEINKDELTPIFGEKYLKMRRQDLKSAYIPNGAIFISTPKYLFKNKGFHGDKVMAYLMDGEKSIDIDTEFDFKIAEFLINNI